MPRDMFDLDHLGPEGIERRTDELHSTLRRQIADFLEREIVDGYEQRQATAWDRDHSSIDAYLDSIEPMYRRWRSSLGEIRERTDEYDPVTVDVLDGDDVAITRVKVRMFDEYPWQAGGLLGVPTTGEPPYPLVICQHGAASSPEKTFGSGDPATAYHGYARELVREGYAVYAPRVLKGATSYRDHFDVICRAFGTTVKGLDMAMLEQALDYLETRSEVDADRIAMWGISQGGAATMFHVPAIRRIDVAICTAWFNEVLKKYVLLGESPRHYDADDPNTHFYVPDLFRAFKSADLASLICPRPLQVQAGVHDNIAWPPYVRDEFAEARTHYERLGIADRIELRDHQGGHEIDLDAGLAFLEKHL